jgi:hypothetical protein
LSKATTILVACDKNSCIGQVKKTHFSSSEWFNPKANFPPNLMFDAYRTSQ